MNEPNDKLAKVSKPRRRFDQAFRDRAVDLSMQPGRRVRELAAELEISEYTLTRWRSRHAQRASQPQMSEGQKDQEIRRLRQEVQRLQEREHVLKKSPGIPCETPGRSMP